MTFTQPCFPLAICSSWCCFPSSKLTCPKSSVWLQPFYSSLFTVSLRQASCMLKTCYLNSDELPAKKSLVNLVPRRFRILYLRSLFRGLPGGSLVKNPPVNARDAGNLGSIPGLERSPGGENGHSLQYSCLENPMHRGALLSAVHRVVNRARLSYWAHTHT